MNEFLSANATEHDPGDFVHRHGRVLTRFDQRSQDSGNVSWLVETKDGDFSVKTAGTLGPLFPDAPKPYLDHPDRVLVLRNAVEIARSCNHPCLARLRNVIESSVGPILIYDKAPGELIGTTKGRRDDPHTAYVRLAQLPAERLLGVFDSLLDLHAALAKEGWVAIDLYDGCPMLDFATGHLTAIDLDNYRRGPGVNTMGRMFGATRYMAPEEFVKGAPIDQRTTVYTLGRLVWHFCTRLTKTQDISAVRCPHGLCWNGRLRPNAAIDSRVSTPSSPHGAL